VRRRAPRLPALGLLLLAGCQPAQEARPRYVVGDPYSLGGVWSYPREDFSLRETGLAAVAADRRAGRRTANGEIHDPARASAAHRTLQLPAAVTVTNLENGRSLRLRVNDRGPADPGRVVELSRRAAELLGVPPGGTAQVALAVAPEESRALAARARPAAAGAESPFRVAAAPRDAVSVETLPAPPGAREAPPSRVAAVAPVSGPANGADGPAPPDPDLPERVVQGVAAPGRLFVEVGTFSGREAAARLAAWPGMPGVPRVEPVGTGRYRQFRVRIGPLPGVAEADRTLEQVLASGVSEARILVD